MWFAIRVMVTLAVFFSLYLHQIDYVQAYPQAPIETDMFMELPQGIETCHGNLQGSCRKASLQPLWSEEAGHVWNNYMVEKLNMHWFHVFIN